MIRPPPILLEKHLLAFGSIVQLFARFERQVEIAVCAFLGSKFGPTAMTMASLGYAAKCDALLSLTTTTVLPPQLDEGIRAHLKAFNAYSGLRNAIAHHVWKEGVKPGTVKPVSIASRGGTGKLKGFRDDEPEYSADDLMQISNRLVEIHDSFAQFLIASGMMRHMFEKSDDNSAS